MEPQTPPETKADLLESVVKLLSNCRENMFDFEFTEVVRDLINQIDVEPDEVPLDLFNTPKIDKLFDSFIRESCHGLYKPKKKRRGGKKNKKNKAPQEQEEESKNEDQEEESKNEELSENDTDDEK